MIVEPDRPASLFPDFFIVGVGRSGTTLARAIVIGHPSLEVPPETGFLPTLLRLKRLWWGRRGLRVDLFIRLAFANGRLNRAGVSHSDAMVALTRRPPRTPSEAISRLYEVFAHEGVTTRVGDKTPFYGEHVALLSSTFPDSVFIHMVRHPLDVVASLLQQPWGPSDPVAAAALWLKGVRACSDVKLQEERMLVVRLEDLVQRPTSTVDLICRHLGVTAQPQMLRFSERAGTIQNQNVHSGGHAGLQHPLTTTRDWRDHLSPADAAKVWNLVADTAMAFGYSGPELNRDFREVSLLNARARLAMFRLSRGWRRSRSIRRLVSR